MYLGSRGHLKVFIVELPLPLGGPQGILQCVSPSEDNQKTFPSPKWLTVMKTWLAWEGSQHLNFKLT